MNGWKGPHARIAFSCTHRRYDHNLFQNPVDVPGLVTSFGLPEFYLRFESPDALNRVVYEIGPTVSTPVYTKRKYFLYKRNTCINCE